MVFDRKEWSRKYRKEHKEEIKERARRKYYQRISRPKRLKKLKRIEELKNHPEIGILEYREILLSILQRWKKISGYQVVTVKTILETFFNEHYKTYWTCKNHKCCGYRTENPSIMVSGYNPFRNIKYQKYGILMKINLYRDMRMGHKMLNSLKTIHLDGVLFHLDGISYSGYKCPNCGGLMTKVIVNDIRIERKVRKRFELLVKKNKLKKISGLKHPPSVGKGSIMGYLIL